MPLISLDEAVAALSKGEVVAIPTETVYGLAGRIDREDTLKQIFEIKSRPFFDPLIVHVHSVEQAKTLTTDWPGIYADLANAFWPGPLTLVCPKAPSVSPLITAGLPTVAIRCPKHMMALEILKRLNVPLAAPSANRFGHTSPTYSFHVENEFAHNVNIVEGGACSVGVESTVLSAEHKNGQWEVKILRPGGISRLQVEDLLRKKEYKFTIERVESSASPGHTKHHYQPRSPVVIVESFRDQKKLQQEIEQNLNKPVREITWLKLPNSPQEAARLLYQKLRDLSRDENVIAVQRYPEHSSGDWEAIWDRLERAATLYLK